MLYFGVWIQHGFAGCHASGNQQHHVIRNRAKSQPLLCLVGWGPTKRRGRLWDQPIPLCSTTMQQQQWSELGTAG